MKSVLKFQYIKKKLLKNNYQFRNVYLKLILYTGMVVNAFYFIIFNKKRKYFIFLGLISQLSRMKSSFTIINSVHGELIKINISYISPSLIFMEKCYKYNFYSKKNNFFFKKKLILTNFINYTTKFKSTIKLMEVNFYKLLMYSYIGRLGFFLVKKKKLKRLRKKFRY